jgi:hypothetical protein
VSDRRKTHRRKRGSFLRLLVWGLTAWALVSELRKPSGERQWHGHVAGFVPYDFRIPTFARVRSAVWEPEDEQLVKPNPFGVGWTLNLGRVVHLVRGGS